MFYNIGPWVELLLRLRLLLRLLLLQVRRDLAVDGGAVARPTVVVGVARLDGRKS